MTELAEKLPPDAQVKLYMVGDQCVGKTCLMLKFSGGTFTTEFISTVGIDFKHKTVLLNNKRVKIQIWDTAGQERFRTITSSYLRGAQGIILVYDITDQRSFDSIEDWIEEIRKVAVEDVVLVLVGNKSDLDDQRVISEMKGSQLAAKYGLKFFETSAKLHHNIEEVFITAAREVLSRSNLNTFSGNIKLDGTVKGGGGGDGERKERGGCC